MQFILRTIAIFVAVGVAVWLVPGIDIVGTGSSWGPIAVMALIIALLNMTIKPFLQLIGLPITVLSLGVFYLVINTILLYVAASMGNALFGADSLSIRLDLDLLPLSSFPSSQAS